MPDSEPACPDDPAPLRRRGEAPAAERRPRDLPPPEASPALLDETDARRSEPETQIDASRQDQAELARSRERDYRTLAENLPGLAYRVHLGENRRTEFFNQLVGDMTGYAPGELATGIVCSIDPLIVEEDRQGVIDIVNRALRERRPFTAAYRITHRDGTIRHFEEWGRPICGEDGRPIYVDGVILDVTDREGARDAQRRQQTLLESVMQTTDVLLVLLDGQFNFVWVNRAYADTCRMKPEEMVGQNHFALYPDPENEAIFRKVRDTGESVYYRDKPFEFPDQPERGVTYWNWSLSPVKDPGGQVTNLVFSLRETTKFKRAVAALRESEQRLALAASDTRIGMFDWDINTGEVAATEQQALLLGFPITPAPAATTALCRAYHRRDWAQRIHPDDRVRVEAALQRCLAERAPYEAEYRIVWPDSSVHWIAMRGVLHGDAQQRPQRMLGITLDVTDHKRAEEALRSSESRYRELVHLANSAIVRWSRDGTITFFNEYAEKFFGWRADEVLGRPVGILLPDEDSAGGDLTGLVAQIVDQPDRYATFVNENVCRDGRRVWMAWTNRAIRDDRGEVTEVLAVGTDITERKRAEEALRRLNETLEVQVTERTAVAERRARGLRRLAAQLSDTHAARQAAARRPAATAPGRQPPPASARRRGPQPAGATRRGDRPAGQSVHEHRAKPHPGIESPDPSGGDVARGDRVAEPVVP
jgi:PAS domain S-box-containing protein